MVSLSCPFFPKMANFLLAFVKNVEICNSFNQLNNLSLIMKSCPYSPFWVLTHLLSPVYPSWLRPPASYLLSPVSHFVPPVSHLALHLSSPVSFLSSPVSCIISCLFSLISCLSFPASFCLLSSPVSFLSSPVYHLLHPASFLSTTASFRHSLPPVFQNLWNGLGWNGPEMWVQVEPIFLQCPCWK